MAIIVNNKTGSKIDVSEDGSGNTIIEITSNDLNDEVKKGFAQLANPNSYPSKMLNKAVQTPRRR